MATPKLKVDLREKTGTKNSNKLRKEGLVPGVLYGHNKNTKEIQVKEIDLDKIISRYGSGTMVNADLNGEVVPALIKDVQKSIIKNGILHVDLQQLSENETVKLSVPIILENKESVESSTAIVQQQLMEVDIQCLPKHIPNSINVDAKRIEEGKPLTVADLKFMKDENIEVLSDEGEIIALFTSASTMVEDEGDEIEIESEGSILEE